MTFELHRDCVSDALEECGYSPSQGDLDSLTKCLVGHFSEVGIQDHYERGYTQEHAIEARKRAEDYAKKQQDMFSKAVGHIDMMLKMSGVPESERTADKLMEFIRNGAKSSKI